MKNIVTFGEIMMRLATKGHLRFSQANSFDIIYGGGEANVAISLANFGMPVEFVTRLPNNDIGQSALMELRKHNSAMSHIEPGMVDWKNIFKNAQWFHWTGITPAISKSAADSCLEAIRIASKMGITISTDLNYREKLWKYDGNREKIMTELTSYSDIILGNEEDAEKHFGIKPEAIDVNKNGKKIKRMINLLFSPVYLIISSANNKIINE